MRSTPHILTLRLTQLLAPLPATTLAVWLGCIMKSRYSITHGNSKHYLFEILNNVTGDWLRTRLGAAKVNSGNAIAEGLNATANCITGLTQSASHITRYHSTFMCFPNMSVDFGLTQSYDIS